MNQAMKKKGKVVAVVGPTAVGKTALSLELAARLNGEIINGDAMQVYKGLDIGTAKIPIHERRGIPHHLIDFLPPDHSYTVADFQAGARQWIHKLNEQNKLPVLVGGTGLYIKAALYDYQFSDIDSQPELRQELEYTARIEGAESLYHKLQDVDPVSAEKIHPNNVKRVIRALEVFYTTGVPFSRHQQNEKPKPLYNMVLVGLTMDRDMLYERINQRVDEMIEAGLIEEARHLYDLGIKNTQSVQAIGYKELYLYFDGKCSLDEAVRLLKRNSRRFAKRQFTWFKRQMDITWFDMTDYQSNFSQKAQEILAFVAGKFAKESK
ncbi:tRNA dimethylallyltransferase [Scopulibacillus daqui]|uniref:tRNA dimethylallyltransferase n=1 Tax=Scopulibacillus daqui TaxID=1469162 RepID=A0ABS2PXY3_9BACL|nr:tRNA dimethylallyltransferase [Scopulibacillus daqui]